MKPSMIKLKIIGGYYLSQIVYLAQQNFLKLIIQRNKNTEIFNW